MHIDELHRRISAHAAEGSRDALLARILHPGNVFCTAADDGRITVWAVTGDGTPTALPDGP